VSFEKKNVAKINRVKEKVDEILNKMKNQGHMGEEDTKIRNNIDEILSSYRGFDGLHSATIAIAALYLAYKDLTPSLQVKPTHAHNATNFSVIAVRYRKMKNSSMFHAFLLV
jgi:hypothetical protein